MKRSPALRQLSREHHSALSLSLSIARATDPATREALMTTVTERFRDELEMHFQEEERGLLPQLAKAGETGLVERTLDEHARIRALARAIADGDTTALTAFGSLLHAHVRFEERELFMVADRRLFSDDDTP